LSLGPGVFRFNVSVSQELPAPKVRDRLAQQMEASRNDLAWSRVSFSPGSWKLLRKFPVPYGKEFPAPKVRYRLAQQLEASRKNHKYP